MKRRLLYILLCAEFAALFALTLLSARLPELFSSLMAFPFEQAGALLRALALTGRVGSGLALAVLAGLALLPLVPALRHWGEAGRAPENAALCFLTALLLPVLYGMANPAALLPALPAADAAMLPVVRGVMGAAVWSVAVLWAVLRLLRLFRAGDTPVLFGYLRVLMYALCALFTGVIALYCGGTLAASLAEVRSVADGLMTALRFLAGALPYALDIAVTLSALTLLDALLSEDDSAAAENAEGLSRLCCLSLGLTAASVAAMNALQLLLSRSLTDISVTANIPLTSIAFVLAALLVARLIAENRRLRDDNDLFI